jgi:hypothetical protein
VVSNAKWSLHSLDCSNSVGLCWTDSSGCLHRSVTRSEWRSD